MSNEQKKAETHVTLIYHKPNVISFQLDPKEPLYVLKAGANIVPAKIVELMKKDSILNGKIEAGVIEIVQEDLKTADPAEAYKSLKPKAKRDMITNATEQSHLEAWKAVEKNAELLKLIDTQLEKVSGPIQFREE
jgi:hypothetical protein